MRRSTVLSLPLQLEFPAQSLFTINEDLSALKQKTWRPTFRLTTFNISTLIPMTLIILFLDANGECRYAGFH
jgi:hypothetical protein